MDTARKYKDPKKKAPPPQLPPGRVPPQSVEAEESVLGSILLDNQAINICLERLRATDFYRTSHQIIFEAMAVLTDRREPIDIVTLAQQLRTMGQLENVGGTQALSYLASVVPNSANVAFYSRAIKEMSIRRQLIHESNDIIHSAFDLEGEIEGFLDSVEQRILGVSDFRINASFHRVGDIVQDSIRIVEKLYDQKEAVTGLASGLSKLDMMTAGFQPSDLIIVAARPAMGKTSLVLGWSQFVGIAGKKPVAFFSLEMSKEQLVLRMLCSESRINNSSVRTGDLTERDFARIVDGASRLAEAPIFIDDTPAITITELRAKARRLHRDHKLGIIMVDYLQLLRSPAYSHSREQEISDISRSLKALAKELNVPVIALSQLNRSVESRTDKRPMQSDLRESGAIEQDADIIMFIYRDEVYNKESLDKGVAEIIIAKQRTGPTGTVRVAFSGEYTRFDNLEETDPGGFPIDDGGAF
jgi:replicative DNA helicase